MSDKLREKIKELFFEAGCYRELLEWGADQSIAIIVEGLKKQIDIKREYAFGESLFGSLEHQREMSAMVNAYDVVLKLIKDIGGK